MAMRLERGNRLRLVAAFAPAKLLRRLFAVTIACGYPLDDERADRPVELAVDELL
jgi:hypothetical protein